MYRLYEKVQKSSEYMYGSKPIEDNENPFLEGPCLLCISAQKLMPKSVFGITKEGMKMARLRVRGEQNAGYDIKDFPVKFLSIRLEKDKLNEEENMEIFTNTYLVPLISKNSNRLKFNEAMKNMRNINIMTYCDGTIFAQRIENVLLDKMKKLGYSDIEAEAIISQLCMFPIATDRLDGNQKSTCISFKDINDFEVYDEINENYSEKVKDSPIGESIIKLSHNELAYLIDGTGDHDLKQYLKIGKALPVSLSSIISKALQNSIENYNSEQFIPIDIETLTEDIENIISDAKDGKTKEELMQKLDEKIEYKGARKLTKHEIELLDILDNDFDKKIKEQLAQKTKQSSNNNIKNQSMQKSLSSNNQESEITSGFFIPDKDALLSHEEKAEKLQNSVKKSQELSEQINEINKEFNQEK